MQFHAHAMPCIRICTTQLIPCSQPASHTPASPSLAVACLDFWATGFSPMLLMMSMMMICSTPDRSPPAHRCSIPGNLSTPFSTEFVGERARRWGRCAWLLQGWLSLNATRALCSPYG